jgi:hypothetical protein
MVAVQPQGSTVHPIALGQVLRRSGLVELGDRRERWHDFLVGKHRGRALSSRSRAIVERWEDVTVEIDQRAHHPGSP